MSDTFQPPLSRRHLFKLLAVTATAWGIAAAKARAQATTGKPASPGPALLRIGYQKSAANLVIIKQLGWLEQRLPGTQVRWIEFPAGPQLLEALAVGALEFGLTGDSPPVFAQAAGKDLLYVAAEPPKPDSSALLVLGDSPLKTLADLMGRKIAVQKGSSAHYLLVRAVDKASLQWNDIQPIYLTPADARAAFERKSVDAWAIWDPFYAATELAVRPRVLATGRDLASNNSFYLASRPFAAEHAATLLVLFEELTRADRLVQQKRPEAIKLIADFSGLDAGVVSLFLQRRPPSPVGPLSPSTVADQQRVADAFHRIGLIPKPVQVADIVWRPDFSKKNAS
ncbi:aliphatic sulfonate ABC transporter substrate-binding protein [Hydrogenophaga sp.]|uniref:aliphatic sulfonate ABC transporter substrate-binding protein n=1 Tax=Hydrogenophaga sp. TaxID=1904254 RepID=UPI0027300F43|nr:aliphatic sulfonate ABC transporter substrate-binding protein [Hydrogenophaga sp.]MDP2017366.1 aliphatic sulfonate ABC transporter substrate-binding protein [Hydrogenophaga sp.]MDP3168616.1 aliphatic sulfonate ABC transporter substrate-binding protein [Hydrogenophaga sp.]MDP3812593.1 aliphatic sulfonate ABC transporter substrate-binding protein [Hydrogenophaga sp.]